MKRTIIALAVGTAVSAPAAYADVTLSGNINAGPAVVKSGDGSTGAANSLNTTGPTAQHGITRARERERLCREDRGRHGTEGDMLLFLQ